MIAYAKLHGIITVGYILKEFKVAVNVSGGE